MIDILTNVPPSDGNFASALENANLEELNDALEHATTQRQKTRYNKLRSEIHRRSAESSYDYEQLPPFAEAQAAADERIKADEIIIGRFLYPDQSAPSLLMMCDYDPRLARIAYDRAEDPTRKQELARLLNIPPSAAPVGDAEQSAPSEQLAVATGHSLAIPDEDAISGKALTEQYHLAVGGMRQVLRFGVMMMQLRDRLDLLTPRVESKGSGRYAAGSGVKAWLTEYAPEIKESTAYRFLHVAEAVAADFATPDQISFIDLVTTAPDALTAPMQVTQSELWEFVDGTSQKSWLDRFAPPAPKPAPLPLKHITAEDTADLRRRQLMEQWASLDRQVDYESWKDLSDSEIETSISIATRFAKTARDWLAIPRKDRVAKALAALAAK